MATGQVSEPADAATSEPRRRPKLSAYFRAAPPATAAEIEATLWNRVDDGPALLEQYKLYVEMADRVSQRRSLANTFFLTLNTAIMTAIGVFAQHRPDVPDSWLVFPLVGLLAQCLTWFWTLRSYRQLNSGKWAVVGAMEARLPASPYWRAEWKALGEGKDPACYWPVSHVEQWIPFIFAATYLAGFITILLAS